MMAHPSEHVLERAPRFATLAEALADVDVAVGKSSKIVSARDAPALDLERARALLPSATSKTAFVFGNERTGMKLDEAALCQRVVRLQTPGPEPSMNLSHAVAVVLEIVALSALVDVDPRAPAVVKERLLEEWLGTLDGAGYFKASTPAYFAPRLREILDKMDVSERDVELLRGMFRFLADRSRAPR